ncbi:MAG: alkylation response protein AidB-like acyl-CoA dehydrogenase [Acidimicrobiales bacterium]|jgi:alkylation response protein AidB-like acyl-CoA dehydrogenase
MNAMDDPVAVFLPDNLERVVTPLLAQIAAQAEQADATRSIDPEVIAALKASDVMKLAATSNIDGVGASVLQIGRELEAIAANCTSSAWTIWNHLAVFHLFVGCLGPDQHELIRGIVNRGEWVCFGAGAGSAITGVIEGDTVRLNGSGAFSSGSRYADWGGAAFVVVDDDGKRVEPLDIRFTVVPLAREGVEIDPTWDGSGVRASATDDIGYTNVSVPLDRCVPWYGANRAAALREVPVVDGRYREDWVGLSDIWLGWMGVGLVRAALHEATAEIRERKSIMGKKMVTRPTVQVNLGRAAALVAAAAATMETACRQVDERVESQQVPDEADYLRQMALATSGINQLDEAMQLLMRCQGGNGLRESRSFQRRWRDFQAMPLHINIHQDRVHHQLGRFVLGEDLEAF